MGHWDMGHWDMGHGTLRRFFIVKRNSYTIYNILYIV